MSENRRNKRAYMRHLAKYSVAFKIAVDKAKEYYDQYLTLSSSELEELVGGSSKYKREAAKLVLENRKKELSLQENTDNGTESK
jgi:hypothetical protein